MTAPAPSRATLWLTGLVLLNVPTIQYSGYFLVPVVSGWADLALTDFQRAFFRAGHAHALALVGPVLADWAALPSGWGGRAAPRSSPRLC